jgi:hypothetical protein
MDAHLKAIENETKGTCESTTSVRQIKSATRQEVKARALPLRPPRRRARVAYEGCRAEKMRKHGKSLGSLKFEDTMQKKGGEGQQTHPSEQPRRLVIVARKGCREERVLSVVELVRPYCGERHWRGSGEEREYGWGRSGESQVGAEKW